MLSFEGFVVTDLFLPLLPCLLLLPLPTNLETIPRYKPPKTIKIENHCTVVKVCPNFQTLNKIVRNFRVVVMVVHINGENNCIVKKMNICPIADVRFNFMIV